MVFFLKNNYQQLSVELPISTDSSKLMKTVFLLKPNVESRIQKKENVYERKYESLYNFINRSEKSNVKCDIEDVKDDPKKMRVTFSVNNKQICNFDMKQMISHLLGVATAFLNGTMNVKDITFIYLLFDPTQIEINDKDAKSKIYEVYNNTCYECVSTDFKTLFEIIVDYLKLYKKWDTDIKTNDLAGCFSFTLCTQENINKWFI